MSDQRFTPPPAPPVVEVREIFPFQMNVQNDPGKDFRPVVERTEPEEVQLPKGAHVASEATGPVETTVTQPELIFDPEPDTAETVTASSTPPPPPSSNPKT